VSADRPSNALHGLEPTAHGPRAPARPRSRGPVRNSPSRAVVIRRFEANQGLPQRRRRRANDPGPPRTLERASNPRVLMRRRRTGLRRVRSAPAGIRAHMLRVRARRRIAACAGAGRSSAVGAHFVGHQQRPAPRRPSRTDPPRPPFPSGVLP
jgi:hypothetical protein